jgi:hypothetical protein
MKNQAKNLLRNILKKFTEKKSHIKFTQTDSNVNAKNQNEAKDFKNPSTNNTEYVEDIGYMDSTDKIKNDIQNNVGPNATENKPGTGRSNVENLERDKADKK